MPPGCSARDRVVQTVCGSRSPIAATGFAGPGRVTSWYPAMGPSAPVARTGDEAAWERFLLAQVLPLAAVMAGHEVLHASAVTLGGRALGLAGPSGAGKSTLARLLGTSGATFLTDDVLALSEDENGVRAHPGPALVRTRSALGRRRTSWT